MHFVATDSIAENVARVLERAQAGGHDASEREIRAIHRASIANLATAIIRSPLTLNGLEYRRARKFKPALNLRVARCADAPRFDRESETVLERFL
jgi:hypothetical protein